MRLDMHVTIVNLEPGAEIPFMETHVMEHGLYVLEGKGVYRLNRDWVEVEAGDFMWLRAFCPQGCYAGGPGRFRYLLYKDVNRHAAAARARARSAGDGSDAHHHGRAADGGGVRAVRRRDRGRAAPSFPINGGMCDRFHDLARTEVLGEGARSASASASGRPYALPLTLGLVERHPLGSQAFVPLTADPFLVVVAPDEDGAPGAPLAFLTRARQGVNYLRNSLARRADAARPRPRRS